MKWLGVGALLALSCGPVPGGGNPSCCITAVIVRDQVYEGTIVTDAGVTTRVQLIMPASGETRLIFQRDGNELVERFNTSPVP